MDTPKPNDPLDQVWQVVVGVYRRLLAHHMSRLIDIDGSIPLSRDAISGYTDLHADGQRYRHLHISHQPRPFTGVAVYTAKHLRDLKLQQALLQFFKPENYFEVRDALMKAGRSDLIGSGSDCLIPSQPPNVAVRARLEKASKSLGDGEYVHTIPDESFGPKSASTGVQKAGDQLARKMAKRRGG